MPSKSPAQRLRDIIENIDSIGTFVKGMDFAAFRQDRRTLYAVTRALEIISEATRRLPEDLKSRHPQIDWIAVAAAGNIYRHEYDSVDERFIWRTVQHDLEPLRQIAEAELTALD
jgi:uncharacterized protein with HEPN domain